MWLVAGFRLQSTELNLQREEITLQRIALQQQAKELSNSARLSSLGQIKALLEEAEAAVCASPLGIMQSSEILAKFIEGMEYWKAIDESRDPQIVQASYSKWLPAEAAARLYLTNVALAMRIYIEYHHPAAEIDNSKDPEDFVYIYQAWVNKAPFLSNHAGPAGLLAQFVWMMGPGLERMRFAWMVASAKLMGKKMLKEGALEEMRDKILQRGSDLPAVCNPWPD